MTLKEAIKAGKLPDFGDKKNENKYKKIGKLLGLNINDLNYVLDENNNDLDRIRYNYEINVSLVKERIKKSQKIVLNNYDELINKYTNLSKEMGKKFTKEGKRKDYYLKDSKKDLNVLLKELKDSKKEYERNINHIKIFEENLGLDSDVLGSFEEFSIKNLDRKEQKLDEKLINEYNELNELKNNKYKTKFMKKIAEERISKVQNRIKKLQNKQGVLQNKQQKIINKGIDRYKAIKQNQINNYLYKINQIDEYQKTKVQLREEQELYNSDIKEVQKEIDLLNKKDGIFNKFRKISYINNQKTLERKRDKLRTREEILDNLRNIEKQGTVTFSTQIYKHVVKAVYGM